MLVCQVAFDDRQILSLAQDSRFGKYRASLDWFEEIHFHFNSGCARASRQRQIECQTTGRVRKGSEHSAMHNAMNLHVAKLHVHSELCPADFGMLEAKTKLPGRVAEMKLAAQSLDGQRSSDVCPVCHFDLPIMQR